MTCWKILLDKDYPLTTAKSTLSTIISTALFWPESVKMKLAGKASSILTQLPTRSVFRLAAIAVRKPMNGRTENDKRAIRAVLKILAGKTVAALMCVCLALVFYDFTYLILLVPFFIFPFIDWNFWDQELEIELRRELNLRQQELGIITADLEIQRRQMSSAIFDQICAKVLKGFGFSVSDSTNLSAGKSIQSNEQSTVERTRNGSLDGGQFAVVSEKEAQSMAEINIANITELQNHALEIANRGKQFYKNLPANLIDENQGRCIRINVNTGEYLMGDDRLEIHQQWSRKFDNSIPSWNAVIGVPTYGGRANRLLQ
ncbi:hypothetical protein [Parasphingorhabdus sp.]|uniref:hypothetical protein n=1 Tax=Parasphingorhabdus sp. TaxID=2709688 RepID=UPI0030014BC2